MVDWEYVARWVLVVVVAVGIAVLHGMLGKGLSRGQFRQTSVRNIAAFGYFFLSSLFCLLAFTVGLKFLPVLLGYFGIITSVGDVATPMHAANWVVIVGSMTLATISFWLSTAALTPRPVPLDK